MKSNRERGRGATHDGGRLLVTQALPRDQQQGFAIRFGEHGQGAEYVGIILAPSGCEGARRRLQPFQQRKPPPVAPRGVREHAAGYAEQPGKGLLGHLFEPAPSHREGLRDHVVCAGSICATQRVSQDMAVPISPQPLQLRFSVGGHTESMSG